MPVSRLRSQFHTTYLIATLSAILTRKSTIDQLTVKSNSQLSGYRALFGKPLSPPRINSLTRYPRLLDAFIVATYLRAAIIKERTYRAAMDRMRREALPGGGNELAGLIPAGGHEAQMPAGGGGMA